MAVRHALALALGLVLNLALGLDLNWTWTMGLLELDLILGVLGLSGAAPGLLALEEGAQFCFGF